MGGTSKFKFPMPHRRSRQPNLEVQTISAPMTNKAQKLLGTAEINVDSASPTSSNNDPSRFWETRSAVSGISGISVTISETTATGTTTGAITRTRSPLSTLDESTVATHSRSHGQAWDQESNIIPKGLGRTQNMDTITDASSVRRRGSSSTIASYYDKTKLPLSISQQTSNSAMAKGLPNNKTHELLDMTSPRPAPSPPKLERKKPTKLDLTHLLPTAGASSRNPLARLAHKRSMVLGSDLMTRSPSVMSMSSAASPSETEPKAEKKPRRKLTRESLRSLRSLRPERHSTISTEEPESSSPYKRTTDAGTLYQLYEHYESTSFRDTMNVDAPELGEESQQGGQVTEPEQRAGTRQDSHHSASPASSTPIKARHHLFPSPTPVSRQPFSSNSTFDAISETPLSGTNSGLVSPPTDYAGSVSSRHTRTSRASKWTDQSFTDFDPNANSVLSLSSDSEDDFSEPPRTAMSVPSVASLESTSSPPESRRPSNTSQESIRKQPKSKFRPSLNPQGHFLAIPEDMNTADSAQPVINARTSSLASALAAASTTNNSHSNAAPSVSTSSSVRSPSRLSQVSTSTSESIGSQPTRPLPRPPMTGRQTPEIRHVAMLQSRTTPTGHRHHESAKIAETPHDSPREHKPARISQPMSPISPSSMDSTIQAQQKSPTEQDSPVLTLNGTGGAEDERFMAVTRQEELLLAAMRARRALIRKNHQAGDIEGLDRSRVEDDRTASKKESLSSIKTVKAKTLHKSSSKSRLSEPTSSDNGVTMLFPNPPSSRSSSPTIRSDIPVEKLAGRKEEAPVYLDRAVSTAQSLDVAKPISDMSDFMRFEAEQFPAPPSSSMHSASATKPSRGRASSAASAMGSLTYPKTAQQKSSPQSDSDFMTVARPSSVQTHRRPDMASRSNSKTDWRPTEFAPVVERPESASSHYESEEETKPPPRMKAVRISAVGTQLPEIGQWGDDG
ncbi:hypothetical protein VP1G_00443 [Cytospora mali]|uniref:Uncharacterized protein n=1 Tax=Cytospora mali TaxID=578113 RepID=A0A194UMN5_CYTMA|nr:hypothetical protein VP1G_00443 [Valsa mali var. pyri (nom. inval.)]